MSDDRIEPRIMASSTVRPTMVVVPPTSQGSTHSPDLTPGISTAEDVQAVVAGMTSKAAKKLLEPRGFLVRVVPGDEEPPEPQQPTNERANLTVVDGKVTHVALG